MKSMMSASQRDTGSKVRHLIRANIARFMDISTEPFFQDIDILQSHGIPIRLQHLLMSSYDRRLPFPVLSHSRGRLGVVPVGKLT
ncbi:hypothetical protein LSAT2_010262 [Lamellibrachia satsuma]|nr:hypothetical protein LSAT2_010262 [Lamellibrachia satsuma]